MRPLYAAIIVGLGALYWVSMKQQDEHQEVRKGNISEGYYAQEAPPSSDDLAYIKKFVPDYDANAPV